MKKPVISLESFEENKVTNLKRAILQGLKSPKVEDFDFDKHLAKLKAKQVTKK